MALKINRLPTNSPTVTTVQGGTEPNGRELVSPWLYLAGMLVTLSGLFAVNFGIEDQSFVFLTYGLAIGGYVISYLLRIARISLRALQVPLVVCIGLMFFAMLSSERGLSWFAPSGMVEDRAKNLQLVFVWLAIVHSYLLNNDAAVLFACVPCITMIALVSTISPDPTVQSAFLIFIGASTFLLVHENYLRTRHATMKGRTEAGERRLFGGQLQLTAMCVIGALVLANFVAVPIKTVGQNLFLPDSVSALKNTEKKNTSSAPPTRNDVQSSIDLATGPTDENDSPVMKVRSAMLGVNLRGETYDLYTGRGFKNTLTQETEVPQTTRATKLRNDSDYKHFLTDRDEIPDDRKHFVIPPSRYELPVGEMEDSTSNVQVVFILNGIFTKLFGAANVQEMDLPVGGLKFTENSTLSVGTSLKGGGTNSSIYTVVSQVADTNPDHLQKTSARPRDVPLAIRERYLQKRNDAPDVEKRLVDLVAQITKGKTNNYDKAEAIRTYISETCKYNLQAPAPPAGEDIVDHFLFQSKQGYCKAFAGAMTMLCRYANIPARLVSGYLHGDYDDSENAYVVRQRHAHVWTEVFFPKVGWVSFDSTDGAEDISDHSGHSKNKNMSFWTWLTSHGWVPPALVLIVLGLLAYVLKTEVWDRLRPRHIALGKALNRPRTNVEIILCYLDSCQALGQKGWKRSIALTADEYHNSVNQAVVPVLPDVQEPLQKLTRLYTQFRYGPDVATDADVQQAREAKQALTQALEKANRTTVKEVAWER